MFITPKKLYNEIKINIIQLAGIVKKNSAIRYNKRQQIMS